MRRALLLTLATVVAVLPAGSATVPTASAAGVGTALARGQAQPTQSGFFARARGFGRTPSFSRRGTRGYGRGYGYRRPFSARRFFSAALKALGIAYLVHLLFGWGAGGGSPIVLLVVLAFVGWLVSRRFRRRRMAWSDGPAFQGPARRRW